MSVGKTKKGIYYFSVRYMDKDGKSIQKKEQNSIWKTKKEALLAEKRFLEKTGNPQEQYNRIKYKDLYKEYIENKARLIKKRSLMTYQEAHNYHILKYFGNVVVEDITSNDIRKWQRTLLNTDYSNPYLKNIQVNFRAVLSWGVKHDYIEKNPFKIDYVKRSEVKKEMNFFTPEEYIKFRSVIDDPIYELVFDVLYWTGLRKGELLALTFEDIDFDNRQLIIRKTYDYRNHETTSPKCRSSYRNVMMTAQLFDSLQKHVNECKKIAGFKTSLFVFGFDKPLSTTTLERHKNLYCKISQVKQIRIHDFRHSHVALLINNDISDYDISKRLGHSRDMVNNTYGHWFKKNQLKLIEKLDDLSSVAINNSRIANQEGIEKRNHYN
jgi:integrase